MMCPEIMDINLEYGSGYMMMMNLLFSACANIEQTGEGDFRLPPVPIWRKVPTASIRLVKEVDVDTGSIKITMSYRMQQKKRNKLTLIFINNNLK